MNFDRVARQGRESQQRGRVMSEGTPTRPGKPGTGVERGQTGAVNYAPPTFQIPRLRLPPFAAMQQGKTPSNGTWIFAGRAAWDRARGDLDKPSRLVTLLPLHDDPGLYRWPVSGDEAVIVHTGGESPETLRALGVTLVKQGAVHVAILGGDAMPQHFRAMVSEVAA